MENLRKRNTFDVLHDEYETDLWIFDEVHDTRDVIAANTSQKVRLASKPCDDLAIISSSRKQRLDRHFHADRQVLALPHLTHAARTDPCVDPIPTRND